MIAKNGFGPIGAFTLGLLFFFSCSSSNNSAPAGNVMTQLESQAVGYMSDSLPSGNSSSASLLGLNGQLDEEHNRGQNAYHSLLSDGTFLDTRTNLKRPARTAEADTSISQYMTDLLDSDYTDGNEDEPNSPTVFFRFQQELEVLKILATQLTWSNGAPPAGTHTLNVEGNDVQATISLVTGNANFDVYIEVAAFDVKVYFKNRDNQANIVSLEEKGGSDFSYSRFFWNRSTGAMSYDYISTGDNYEVSRMRIAEEGGQARLLSVLPSQGGVNRMYIQAPQGGDSETFDLSFERTGDNAVTIVNYCASGTENSAATHVCAGAGSNLGADIAGSIIAEVSDPAELRSDLFGADDAAMGDVTAPDDAAFLDSLL